MKRKIKFSNKRVIGKGTIYSVCTDKAECKPCRHSNGETDYECDIDGRIPFKKVNVKCSLDKKEVGVYLDEYANVGFDKQGILLDNSSVISLLNSEKEKVCEKTKSASEQLSISNPCILCFMGSKEGVCTFTTVADYFKRK